MNDETFSMFSSPSRAQATSVMNQSAITESEFTKSLHGHKFVVNPLNVDTFMQQAKLMT